MTFETLSVISSALVVEDHPAQRRLAMTILRNCGIETIHEAEDGDAGLEAARLHRPQLIICDIDMPNRDGMAMLRQISEIQPSPMVIIVSSIESGLLRTVETLARQNGLTVLAAVPKPLDMLTLQKLLAAAQQVVTPRPRGAMPSALPDEMLIEALRQQWYEPYFEPKIDRHTVHVVGAEVLARLVIPGEGVIPPIRFIERLEKMGRIDEMTWQIAQKSLDWGGRWNREGWPLILSINLSPLMLNDDHAIDTLTEMVRTAQLSPSQVIFELTESAAIDARGPILERLTRLRLRGFGLSIDDFGTGYSSLSQLSSVPFTELKIDRAFSFGATTDFKAKAVAESSIELARKMQMKSCSEGVENQGVFQMMHDLGSDTFQGYLFHKPQPAEAFREWAREWNSRTSLRELYMGTPV